MTIGKRYKFNGSRVQVETSRGTAKKITAITAAVAAVFTATSHGFVAGNTVYIDVTDGLPELAAGEYVVATAPTTSTFTLIGVDTSAMTAFSAGSPSQNEAQLVAFTDFCELTGYSIQGGQADTIDVTTVCSTRKEFEQGLADTGTMTLDYNSAFLQPVQAVLEAAATSGAIIAIRIVYPNSGGTLIVFGTVLSTSTTGAVGDVHKGSASIKLTGDAVRIA